MNAMSAREIAGASALTLVVAASWGIPLARALHPRRSA